MGHIQLSRWSDLIVVAPSTANLLSKMATGAADDLASTLLLATDKRVLVAPAMNVRMWLHPATQRNISMLRTDSVLFAGPNEGDMACGEFGPGRMSEPLEIVAAIEAALANANDAPLRGKRVVVTSGPTHEPIDPVRYIANRSSGRQGHAIAEAAARAGADVTLVSGPVTIPNPPGVQTIHVETALDMLAAVESALPADVFVATAAVADWRVANAGSEKLKKGSSGAPALSLVENPDILAMIAGRATQRPALVVGFAAETEMVIEHAQQKLARKKCDIIVANDVAPSSGVMGGEENTVHLIDTAGVESWPKLPKSEVAKRLVRRFARMLGGGQ